MRLKESVTIEGRSLVFNIAFVLLNLGGLALLVMGYHPAFADSSTLLFTLSMMLLMTSIGGIILFKGRLLMASVSRVLVGGLFIVSGLVKANDPLGFSYKLEEYFEDGALAYRIKELFGAPGFSLEFFMDWALFLSVVICIAEIVLGVLTIIGGKIKLVSYLMILMMIFFTFLTWHTASCDPTVKFADHDTYEMTDPVAQMKIKEAETNKELKIISKTDKELVVQEMKLPQCVDDCGCFGDAMKGSVGRSLTPSESLWKDIVLLYLVIWIFVGQWKITPNTRKQNVVYLATSTLVIAFFSWVFTWYFPILFGIVAVLLALFVKASGGKFLGNYWGSALFVSLLCLGMEAYVLNYEPLKDYRPYAVGSDLREKMNDGIDGVFEYYYFLTDLKTNEKKRVKMSEITPDMWGDTEHWKTEYDTIECVVQPKNPSIMDFNPILPITDLTDFERRNPLIKSVLDTAQTMMLKILDL
ncbi:MAG: DoxX family protein, partial [Bacteroidetes bacterium]